MMNSQHSNRLRIRRHRFYRHLFAVTLLIFLVLAMPLQLFRIYLIGAAVLQLLLLIELGQPIASSYSERRARSLSRLYRLLGVVGLVALCVWIFTPAKLVMTGLPLLIALSVFVLWSLKRLMRLLALEETVGLEVIAGAVAGYLLLGICGGLVLSVIETLQPGSFANLTHHNRHEEITRLLNQARILGQNQNLSPLIWDLDFSRLNYFAFVSLGTVGYGDIVPTKGPAEMASVALSLSGSLYLALVMGLLISRYTVQTQQQDERADQFDRPDD